MTEEVKIFIDKEPLILKLSSAGNLTLEQAIAEHRYLTDFPRPKSGFAGWLQERIETRLTCLCWMITNHVIEKETEQGVGYGSGIALKEVTNV